MSRCDMRISGGRRWELPVCDSTACRAMPVISRAHLTFDQTSNRVAMMHDLTIKAVRRWLVRVPVHTPMVWGSGVRTGVTRLVVELTTADGVVGWGETICLLDAIPA